MYFFWCIVICFSFIASKNKKDINKIKKKQEELKKQQEEEQEEEEEITK